MIKFFRKIRYDLMGTGKTTKYLKYAIGEIILVVIGILIALQINNWNNQRLEDKQMNLFLIGIVEELKSDTLQFQRRIEFFSALAEEKRNILTRSNFEDMDTDSLYLVIRPRLYNYQLNATTFNKIINSGITHISKNDSLSKNIYNYYTNGATTLKSFMDWDIEGSTEAANYYYSESNQFEVNLVGSNIENEEDIVNFQEEAKRKANLIKLLSKPTGRNHIKLDYARKYRIAERFKRFKDNAESLIAEIDEELSK